MSAYLYLAFDERLQRVAIVLHHQTVRLGNALKSAGHSQYQGVVQAAWPLHDRATSSAPPKHWYGARFARLQIDFDRSPVGVAQNHEIFSGLPKPQQPVTMPRFAPIQQRFIAGQIFRRRRERQVKEQQGREFSTSEI